MANADHLEQQIAELREKQRAATPTPPVPYLVAWYDRGIVSPDSTFAAIVTGIEDSGKLKLTIFKPNSIPIHKLGVLHISHPQHKIPSNACTVRNGAWDYPPGEKVPATHLSYHKEKLEEKIITLTREAFGVKQVEDKRALATAK